MSGAPHTLWADNPDRVISDISGSRVDIGVYPKASTKADMPFALSLTTEDKTVAPFATASSSPRHRRWKAVVALAHRLAAEAHMQSLDGTVWRLIEASAFDDDGHELSPPLGKHPMGFVMFEAERIIVAVVDGGLSLPANVSSRAFVA